MTASNPVGSSTDQQSPPAGHVRWYICALLCGAIILIYIHRNVVSVLSGDTFKTTYGWGTIQSGNLGSAFTAGYAIGLVSAGRILDRIGVRRGFLIAVAIWTCLASAHGLVSYVSHEQALHLLMAFRFTLGIVEGAFFPAAIRAVADWYPKRERAFATGIFNAGSAFGALLAPLVVPLIAAQWSWPMAFYMSGGLGLIWIVAWLAFYREPERHPLMTPAELNYIRSDREVPVKSLPWAKIIGYRQTWTFAFGKFMTDPIWWFYIFFLPTFLGTQFKLDLKHFGPPLVIVYLMADGGSIAGGWLSSRLIRGGWSINAGRKCTMLICALCVVPIVLTPLAHNLWLATIMIGLAAAAHQGWSANIFTIASDTAPRAAVSSVVGIGGMAGAIGGVIFQWFVGHIVTWTGGSYVIPFICAGSAYLIALLVIQLSLPNLEQMQIDALGSPDEPIGEPVE